MVHPQLDAEQILYSSSSSVCMNEDITIKVIHQATCVKRECSCMCSPEESENCSFLERQEQEHS